MFVLHRPLRTSTLASIDASSMNAIRTKSAAASPPEKSPAPPPLLEMQTITVTHGRVSESISLRADASVAELRERVAHLVPVHEALLMSRGKKLSDDAATVAGLEKVMLLRRPGSGANTASAAHKAKDGKKVKVTLRCLATGRIVRDVELSTTSSVASLLDSVVRPALGLRPHVRRVIFLPQGKQLLRSDLTLADYPAIVEGMELFVAPNGPENDPSPDDSDCSEATPPPSSQASSSPSSKPGAASESLPKAAGPALRAMAESMPAQERAMFSALVNSAAPDELRVMEAITSQLDSALARTSFGAPSTAAPSAASPARLTATPSSATDVPTGAASTVNGTAASAAAATSSGAAGATSSAVAGATSSSSVMPARIATGMMAGGGVSAGGLPISAAMALDLQRHLDDALKEVMDAGGATAGADGGLMGGTFATDGLLPLPLPPGMPLPPGAVGAFQIGSGALAAGFGGLGGRSVAGGRGGEDERERERLEAVCSKMVDKLSSTAGGGGEKAEKKAEKAEKKASFGQGLKAGFLNRPKKKKRAAIAAEGTKAAAASSAEARGETTSRHASAEIGAAAAAPDHASPNSVSGCQPAPLPAPVDSTRCTPAAVAADDTDAMPPPKKKPASDRRRCGSCCVRLPLTAVHQSVCKCGELFCAAHLHAHACKYDYKAAAKARLRASNPEIAPAKL